MSTSNDQLATALGSPDRPGNPLRVWLPRTRRPAIAALAAALLAVVAATAVRYQSKRQIVQSSAIDQSGPLFDRTVPSDQHHIAADSSPDGTESNRGVVPTSAGVPVVFIEPAPAVEPAASVPQRDPPREPQRLTPALNPTNLSAQETERLPTLASQPAADSAIRRASAMQPEEVPMGKPADDVASVFPTIEVTPIDLPSALSMVDVQNPEFLLAQTRVLEAAAMRQLAAAQFLPTINAGTSYDGHTGNLQQSSGNILSVKRNSLTVGAGVNAVAAGSVNIPGLVWNQNPSTVLFGYLTSRQVVAQKQFATQAERNDVGLRVVQAYLNLLEAEGRRSIYLQSFREADQLTRITGAYARTGQGRPADFNRAATELLDREALVVTMEGDALMASARLAQLLNLDPSLRLHPTDNWVVPHTVVPAPIPLTELLTIALLRRPELQERQAAVREALLALNGQRMLPFSPTIFLGMSADEFGGGSNLVSQPVGTSAFARGTPRFGAFSDRTDFDAMAYWTLRNVGLGNRAQINAAASRLRSADWQRLAVVEQVRMQVANAYARAQARLAQIQTCEEAVAAARDSWTEDLIRIRGNEGLPIEAVNSLRNFARARLAYLTAILEYNREQFELYVSMGQPPADALVRQATPTGNDLPPPEIPPPPTIKEDARP